MKHSKNHFLQVQIKERKAMAEYINVSTGKSVGAEKLIKLASWFMFAPNFRLSLFPTHIWLLNTEIYLQ